MTATLTAPSPVDDRERFAQARRALLDANRTRVQKASIKRDVREGVVTLAEIAAKRPTSLRALPLFALLLELPGFGCRRLDKLNRRAIRDGINLARTLGDASASTLDWLVRTVNGQPEDRGATSDAAAATSEAAAKASEAAAATSEAAAETSVEHEPPAQGARRRLLHGVVGSYQAADGRRRRLVLSAADDRTPVLLDRGGGDERVVERFRATSGLLEVAAVARGYLDEARRLGRPAVAAGDPAAPTQCSAATTDLREQTR
jgi:hypothetical protein